MEQTDIYEMLGEVEPARRAQLDLTDDELRSLLRASHRLHEDDRALDRAHCKLTAELARRLPVRPPR